LSMIVLRPLDEGAESAIRRAVAYTVAVSSVSPTALASRRTSPARFIELIARFPIGDSVEPPTTGDPVGSGLIQSLSRPGGNITGLSIAAGSGIAGKWLEMLREIVP